MRPRPLVLFVDDDPMGREVFQAMLSGEGYDLVSASDGEEALAKAQELVPDLVLLDVMMPVLDGFEVLRRLRADPLLAQVPVVLVTALDDKEARLRGVEAGADDFITKPIDRAELCARVRTVTRLDRFRRLLSEQAKFEWAVQTVEDGFLIVDETDELLYANPRARFFLGLHACPTPAEGKFLAYARKQYGCEPEEAWALWPGAASPGVRYLVRPESRGAAAVWLQADTFPLPAQAAWLVQLRDVTDRLRAQREVWAFHSAVSHKLRTPLTLMVPALEFIASADPELTMETAAKLASSALRGALRLQTEIQDILEYIEVSRRGSGGEELDLAALPQIAREVAAGLGIESLRVSGEDSVEGARVGLSRQTLAVLLGELLENSQKFHPRRSPSVEVLLSRPAAEKACVMVRDDGAALPSEQMARVLTPYYQGERDHTGQIAGMGLGLPMVASILWGVGGACHLQNRPDGPGLVVELVFPLTRGDAGRS